MNCLYFIAIGVVIGLSVVSILLMFPIKHITHKQKIVCHQKTPSMDILEQIERSRKAAFDMLDYSTTAWAIINNDIKELYLTNCPGPIVYSLPVNEGELIVIDRRQTFPTYDMALDAYTRPIHEVKCNQIIRWKTGYRLIDTNGKVINEWL